MKRKEAEDFLIEIIDRIEVLEYTDDGEEGVVSLDELVRAIVMEYIKKVSTNKIKDMKTFISGILKMTKSQ